MCKEHLCLSMFFSVGHKFWLLSADFRFQIFTRCKRVDF